MADVLNTSDTNKYGHRVEIDFSYPEEIHDDLKEFVPALETRAPTMESFSAYQKDIASKVEVT